MMKLPPKIGPTIDTIIGRFLFYEDDYGEKTRNSKRVFSDKTSITNLAKKYDTEKGEVQYYVRLYELHGEKPFSEDQIFRIYKREEKLEAIKEVLRLKNLLVKLR